MSDANAGVHVAGHCYCGAIRFAVDIPAGERPVFTAYCHCDSCRRAHAAPLYHVAAVAKSMFKITDGEEHLNEFTKPGGTITRAFCHQCGTRILNRFGEWRPKGIELVAFFPNLLDSETQRELPDLLRPRRQNRPEESVLEEAMLREFFDAPH